MQQLCFKGNLTMPAVQGLYMDGGGSFMTQCEANGFRRITYSVDRPDVSALIGRRINTFCNVTKLRMLMHTHVPAQVLSMFTVTLTANQSEYPVLLSNGNLIRDESLLDGRHTTTWKDPFPKPRCSRNRYSNPVLLFTAVLMDFVGRLFCHTAVIVCPQYALTRALAPVA